MVHCIVFLPKVEVFGEVKDAYLVKVFPTASDVALILVVVLRPKADIAYLLVHSRVYLINFAELGVKIQNKNALTSKSYKKPIIQIEFNFLDKFYILAWTIVFNKVFLFVAFKIFNLLDDILNCINFKNFDHFRFLVIKCK